MKLKVAVAQIEVRNDDVAANARAIDEGIRFAAEVDADVLLTPEGSLSGYTHNFNQAEVERALDEVTAKARGRSLSLALGTCMWEAGDEKPTNQLRFYAKNGEYLGCHCKILICTGKLDNYISRPLQSFRLDGIPVGGLLCNDLWANPGCTVMADPHLTQQLADRGVKVIFHGVNGGRGSDELSEVWWQYSESNLRLRARAGKIWIVTVDNCHPIEQRCSSPSGIVGPDGDWICRTKDRGIDYLSWTFDIGDT